MSGRTRVSVLLASRDGEAYLDASLASLAAQTYQDFEIVAVDDGSRDGTSARLAAFASQRPRVRVLRTPGIGLAGALARAAEAAEGELLARQDDDDLSHAERLERQVRELDRNPAIGVLGTGAEIIDADGRRTGEYPVPLSSAAIRRAARRVPPFVHGSVMMRREVYERAGGYRDAFRASQDLDLWLRLPADTGLANLPERLYSWRHHAGGMFARARSEQLFFAALAREFAAERRALGADSYALFEQCADPDAFLAAYPRAATLRWRLGEAHAREGRLPEARRHLRAALRARGARARALAWWLLTWPIALMPRAARARAARRSSLAAPLGDAR